MRYQRPRGTQDILPEAIAEWRYAEETFRQVCHCFRYAEIRTPLFEDTELFVRSVGAETDIVSKEMYTFTDRGGRSLTLRPEGTAPVVRAFIENNLQGQDPQRVVKLYYLAPIFRYDRPQAGRYRQHHQAGAEAFGSEEPALDAEIIHLALTFYTAVGLRQVRLLLNSVGCPTCRPEYVEQLRAFVATRLGELCADCRHRYEVNPLRVLDCKQPTCQAVLAEAPRTVDVLCSACASHLAAVQAHLDALGIEYTLEPRLVRGLDYYTKTAFEFVAAGLGAQNAVGGGGRYDGLVEMCGGRPTPAVGVGIGLERVLLVRQRLGLSAARAERCGVLVVPLGDEQWMAAFQLVAHLRQAGLAADLDYRRRSLRAQLRYADSEQFRFAALLGPEEELAGEVTVRDLLTGQQQRLARDQLSAWLQAAAAEAKA
jgi:histidyl-tRNA synthetase